MAEPKFEKDLEKLERIVEALEQGDLSLDDSLKRFEEGIKLAKRCEKALSQAEKKIEVLTKNADGELETKPLAGEVAGDNSPDDDDSSEDDDEEDGDDTTDDSDGDMDSLF